LTCKKSEHSRFLGYDDSVGISVEHLALQYYASAAIGSWQVKNTHL